MWNRKRTSRWSNLKTEKEVEKKPIEKNIIREPLKTNSRWASLKSAPSPRRERNHSPQDKPAKRWSRVNPPPEVEKSWDEIINNNVEGDDDEYKSIINPIIPTDNIYKSIINLKYDKRDLIENILKYKKDIILKKDENERILKQRDDHESKLKRFKLYEYEDKTTKIYSITELNKISNNWTEYVKNVIYEPSKKGQRGRNMKREAKGLSFADCLDRARHIIKNKRKDIAEENSLLKKKYIENEKILQKCNKFIKCYENDIIKIEKRLKELTDLDKSFDTVPYVKPIVTIDKENIDFNKSIKIIQRKWRKYSFKPWWASKDNIIKVKFKNWDIEIERILKKKYHFSEEEEESEISSEEEEVIPEVQEEVPVVPEVPPNPYAELDVVSRNKKIKFYKKKLRQIEKLEKRDSLDEEQKVKIAKRGEFEEELKLLMELDNSNV